MAQDFLRVIPRIFPSRPNWTLVQPFKQIKKKGKSATDFRNIFESLFLRHSCFTKITCSNQPALIVPLYEQPLPRSFQYDPI